MLTIHNLEVRFDVEADDDAVFTRMFSDHIRRWARRRDEEACWQRHADMERSIGDKPGEEP